MNEETGVLQTATSPDGLKRWHLVRRPDGLYSYDEDTFYKDEYWAGEDRSEHDVGVIEYWTPTHFSGLFDTLEAARADAVGSLPWLRDTLTDLKPNGE